MIATVRKWGNSLGVRIPKSVAQDTRLHEGSQIDVRGEGSRVVIVPVTKPVFRLADLLKKVNKENLHKEADFGAPVGKEVW
ncbi:MAG: AbrB/MazE/SpoVT family DNA-binding domain-containing protein [Verrucomicrobia bacterium]|nr:AbrB/MazE/SpoVT family DNA-binding domain-containing protein [Verrucomicrobiota bacterium]MBU1909378.1 AbrB/MazE/SpoVT family DNA-binding domain-containing protein [Verrucomicrobiota bacterium]